MRKIVKYELVQTSSVEKFIETGWQPFGSPLLAFSHFYQAMVKYEEEPKTATQVVDPTQRTRNLDKKGK